ncbi:MAG: hypothetical protein ACQERF_09555 [Actinomycetota bacterium]
MTDTPIHHVSDLPSFDPSAEPLSIIDHRGFELVHVLVNFRDPELGRGEALWATPLQMEADGYGIYILRNNAPLSAFRVGDLVEAVRGCDSHLRVIGVARLAEGSVTEVLLPEETPPALIEATMETWYEEGALFSGEMPGVLLTTWSDELSPSDVLDILERTSPPDWEVGDIPTTTTRALQLINEVEFSVDLSIPATG